MYRRIPAGYEDEDDDVDKFDDFMQNMKITVVPDITAGAGLNGEDFNNALNDDMNQWFDEFRETYSKCNRTPATFHKLEAVLLKDTEPLKLALKFFSKSPGCNYLKNKNMALYILETVCQLYKQNLDFVATCDDNTRMVAFNFIKSCGIVSLYKAVCETYQLQKIQNHLIPKLQILLNDKFFRDAAYWSMFLNCTSIFGIFDLLFPLILQDKIYLAEEFLSVAKEQQLPFVQFLDTLLDRHKTVHENCAEILQKYKYSDVKHSILSYRPLSKLVTRLAKKYNIDSTFTPNLKYSKSCSYLHYLFHKFQDGGMSFDSWRELARDEAIKSKALQLDLIAKITTAGNLDEAMYWALLFQIPAKECPLALQKKLEGGEQVNPAASSDSNDSWDATSPPVRKYKNFKSSVNHQSWKKEGYLTLDLPQESIILIDTPQKFLDMLQYLEQFLLIGFDSEWKPSVNNDNRVSLIQMATTERVYLIDCLSPHLGEDMWKLLGIRIFNNLEILKLGFSLHYDLQMLHKSLPLQLNLQAASCYLDLRDIWRRLKYMQISPFPYEAMSVTGESLCALTEMCLGKKLDKSNQCSNWSNRPLRQDQITYAALDAHCLLKIYHVLSDVLSNLGMDIDVLVEEITTSKTGYIFKSKSKVNSARGLSGVGTLSEWGCHKQKAVKESSRSHKFLCDSMLIGLSRELRKLGLDSLEIKDNQFDLTYYIELARESQRIVLSRDSRFLVFFRELNKELCIQIPADTVEKQLLHILQYFSLKIDPQYLYSRCVDCNGNDFILANRFDMQLMRFGQLQQTEDGSLKYYQGNGDKFCNILKINEQVLQTKQTFRGKNIKIKNIKPTLLYNKDFFFICDQCGLCTCRDENKLSSAVKDFLGLSSPPAAIPASASASASASVTESASASVSESASALPSPSVVASASSAPASSQRPANYK